ncbi:MAG: hypothetical protein AAGD25_09730 [Cyanobacteria bacterium P01_F01_bin.150]
MSIIQKSMSIIKEKLGGPGYFMEVDKAKTADTKPGKSKVAKVDKEEAKAKSASDNKEKEAVEIAADSGQNNESASAPVEAATTSAGNQNSSGVTDVQSLIDNAIAQTTAESTQQEEEAKAERTFATEYLSSGKREKRRRPGPSLTVFRDMAGKMRG